MKTLKTFASIAAIMIISASFIFSTGCKNDKKDETKADSTTAAVPAPPKPPKNPADSIAESMPKTTIKFEKDKIDYGKIKEGEVAKYKFKFTNTGSEPLTITNARGSCGCTVPIWPKEPIAPGGTGELTAEFNSKGKTGNQTKTITVTGNTDPINTLLTITADVIPDPNAPKPAAGEAAAGQPNIQVTPAPAGGGK